ncbi:MAG TPA: glycosyltransferase family 1 protein [Chloroflexota bacterium]|jgi:glycosyltransferase involved in cell wall biosynthesis
MRIVMDATAAVRQQAGVGRFARGLLSGLATTDLENQYYLLTTGRARLEVPPRDLPARHRWIRLPISERVATIAWQRGRLRPSPAQLIAGAGLFVTPDYALPEVGRLPSALTVHDLSFLLFPECADDGLRRYLEKIVPRSLGQASLVLAVSHTTAASLTSLLGVAPERIVVVGNAVDGRFSPLPKPDAGELEHRLAEVFDLQPGYLLTVGTLEPRKNLVRLLGAYAALRSGWTRRHTEHPCPILVIAGREGWRFEPIFREVARLGVGPWVRFYTRVRDQDLLSLYRGAAAFVCASLYEGFGIPPLEAMACGIPVASSTGGALLEVLGEAAVRFDPIDVDGMSAALETVLTDDNARIRLIAAGRARAAAYSWVESARTALSAFKKVAA